LVRADGNTAELENSGAILGRFPHWQYAQTEIGLNHGDTLLLFTDGVVEACDAQNEPFGEKKLLQIVKESDHSNAAALQVELLNAVAGHCGEKFQDDVTMIVLRADFRG
jgi:serine phosphatase RsbU (regulator of sigma subunit)